MNNPDFKPVDFEGFKKEAGRNSFTLPPKKWIEFTGAIGIQSKSGRYGDADMLNVALFGMTAKEWREKNPALDENICDYL